MKKTYQPFIIKLAAEVIEILKDEIDNHEHAKEELCMLLTQKLIDGKISEGDDVRMIFESDDELFKFIGKCLTYDSMASLMEMGLVGVYDVEDKGEGFFLTEKGKLYMEAVKKSKPGLSV